MACVEGRRVAHQHKHFLMFLVLHCLLSAVVAVPATRSFKSIKAYSTIQGAGAVLQLWKRRGTEESAVNEGRMDIELMDYPGPGANKGHQPVTPPH